MTDSLHIAQKQRIIQRIDDEIDKLNHRITQLWAESLAAPQGVTMTRIIAIRGTINALQLAKERID